MHMRRLDPRLEKEPPEVLDATISGAHTERELDPIATSQAGNLYAL